MGVVNKPAIESYWEKDHVFETPFFRKVMSRNHFQAILSCFHYCDDTEEREKPIAERDRLKKLSGFISSLNDSFRCYSPQKNLSIDEGGCPYKGRISFRVYNPMKPNKWSIKTFQLCESETGYTLNVQVYDGSPQTWDESLGLPPNASVTQILVMKLLKDAQCLQKGHHLYMDNYYNSPDMFQQLEKQGVLAAGTVSLARKNTPKVCKVKPMKNVPPALRGKVLWSRKDNLLCLVWYDKRRVATLSTIHKAEAVKALNCRKKEVVKPVVVADYCKYMFGVDLSDQKAYYYTPLRRSYKWWRKLFFHLLNVCVLNAHVLHTKYAKVKLNLYEFRRELALALICRGQVTSRLPRSVGSQPCDARLTERHFPAYNHFSAAQKERYSSTKKRKKHPPRKCLVCGHESVYRCPDCNVCLCPVDCFRIYHTEKVYLPYRQPLQRVASDTSDFSFTSEGITDSDSDFTYGNQDDDQWEDWDDRYRDDDVCFGAASPLPPKSHPPPFPRFPHLQDPELCIQDGEMLNVLRISEEASDDNLTQEVSETNDQTSQQGDQLPTAAETSDLDQTLDQTLTQERVNDTANGQTFQELLQNNEAGENADSESLSELSDEQLLQRAMASNTPQHVEDSQYPDDFPDIAENFQQFVQGARQTRTITDLDTSVVSAVDETIPATPSP